MNRDVVFAIIQYIQPRNLLALTHVNRHWRHMIFQCLPDYRNKHAVQVHHTEKLSYKHLGHLLVRKRYHQLAIGLVDVAVNATVIYPYQASLLHSLRVPISWLRLFATSRNRLIGTSLIPQVLHHVEVIAYTFTDTVLFDHVPAAVTLSMCDISSIGVDYWFHPGSIRSLCLKQIRVRTMPLEHEYVTGLIVYRHQSLVAAKRSHWHTNTVMDIVFAKAPVLFLHNKSISHLDVLECRQLYLRSVFGSIRAPHLEKLVCNNSSVLLNPVNMPRLRHLFMISLTQDVCDFAHLTHLVVKYSDHDMTIRNNPALETLVVAQSFHAIRMGPGNLKLKQVQVDCWCPKIHMPQILIQSRLEPCKIDTLANYHKALSQGHIIDLNLF